MEEEEDRVLGCLLFVNPYVSCRFHASSCSPLYSVYDILLVFLFFFPFHSYGSFFFHSSMISSPASSNSHGMLFFLSFTYYHVFFLLTLYPVFFSPFFLCPAVSLCTGSHVCSADLMCLTPPDRHFPEAGFCGIKVSSLHFGIWIELEDADRGPLTHSLLIRKSH